jgi:hypothetical protein
MCRRTTWRRPLTYTSTPRSASGTGRGVARKARAPDHGVFAVVQSNAALPAGEVAVAAQTTCRCVASERSTGGCRRELQVARACPHRLTACRPAHLPSRRSASRRAPLAIPGSPCGQSAGGAAVDEVNVDAVLVGERVGPRPAVHWDGRRLARGFDGASLAAVASPAHDIENLALPPPCRVQRTGRTCRRST